MTTLYANNAHRIWDATLAVAEELALNDARQVVADATDHLREIRELERNNPQLALGCYPAVAKTQLKDAKSRLKQVRDALGLE